MLKVDEIIERLKGKNMVFTDESIARNFFALNSYYRFRGYFYDNLDKTQVCPTYGKKFLSQISFGEENP